MASALAIIIMSVIVIYMGYCTFQSVGESKTEKILKKDFKDLTDAEKSYMISRAKELYDHGKLTFMEYDVLRAKYSGTKSITEIVGPGAMMDMEVQVAKEKREQEEAAKTIAKDAVIGGIIAGPAGAVTGALIGKSKTEKKK